LGGSRCTWGPAYWCTSQETAVECNVRISKLHWSMILYLFYRLRSIVKLRNCYNLCTIFLVDTAIHKHSIFWHCTCVSGGNCLDRVLYLFFIIMVLLWYPLFAIVWIQLHHMWVYNEVYLHVYIVRVHILHFKMWTRQNPSKLAIQIKLHV